MNQRTKKSSAGTGSRIHESLKTAELGYQAFIRHPWISNAIVFPFVLLVARASAPSDDSSSTYKWSPFDPQSLATLLPWIADVLVTAVFLAILLYPAKVICHLSLNIAKSEPTLDLNVFRPWDRKVYGPLSLALLLSFIIGELFYTPGNESASFMNGFMLWFLNCALLFRVFPSTYLALNGESSSIQIAWTKSGRHFWSFVPVAIVYGLAELCSAFLKIHAFADPSGQRDALKFGIIFVVTNFLLAFSAIYYAVWCLRLADPGPQTAVSKRPEGP